VVENVGGEGLHYIAHTRNFNEMRWVERDDDRPEKLSNANKARHLVAMFVVFVPPGVGASGIENRINECTRAEGGLARPQRDSSPSPPRKAAVDSDEAADGGLGQRLRARAEELTAWAREASRRQCAAAAAPAAQQPLMGAQPQVAQPQLAAAAQPALPVGRWGCADAPGDAAAQFAPPPEVFVLRSSATTSSRAALLRGSNDRRVAGRADGAAAGAVRSAGRRQRGSSSDDDEQQPAFRSGSGPSVPSAAAC
jgi:hypothetical protein